MPSDTARTAAKGASSPNTPLTDEQLTDQAERQSAMRVLRKVAPYLWPDNMPWVKRRVVWAMVEV